MMTSTPGKNYGRILPIWSIGGSAVYVCEYARTPHKGGGGGTALFGRAFQWSLGLTNLGGCTGAASSTVRQ